MKIVVIGAEGMLGHDLVAACNAAGIETAGFDLPDVDISRDDSGLEKLPVCEWAVNCAAYTDVDGSQVHRDKAFAVNRDGAGRVAAWCQKSRIPLIHISTDYVFDGRSTMPYRETDSVNPLNVYGESKLAGERAVQANCCRFLIVRTQSLFGVHGKNFVSKLMSRWEESGLPVDVVSDQTSCPTYTPHLADAILRLIIANQRGLVHVSSSGNCTWYEFACAIADRIRPSAKLKAVKSADHPRPAKRPAYSVLDKSRYTALTRHVMPSWREGLDEYLRQTQGPNFAVRRNKPSEEKKQATDVRTHKLDSSATQQLVNLATQQPSN